MDKPRDNIDHGERAVELARQGYKLVVVRPGSKAPLLKGWQTADYTHDELRRLFADPRLNVGIRTGGDLIVLDIDTTEPEKVEWVREYVGDTPMKVLTPRGGQHWYFGCRRGVAYGNGVKLRGEPYDLRWNGTQAVCPWSRNAAGTAYQWAGTVLPVAELPKLRVSALRDYKRTKVNAVVFDQSPELMIRRAVAYLAKIEPAVSGQGGHNRTFRVACKLTHLPPDGFGLSFDQAWPVFLEYCARCEPPWSVPEARHKLEDAVKKRR